MTSDGFTKLFSSLVTSSIWSEDDKTRIMWITILAITDMDGFCNAAIPGLAAMARMSVEDAAKCIEKLEAPDAFSRTTTDVGRRLARVEGGWMVINHAIYRDRERKEKRREYMKELMAERRLLAANNANTKLTGANPSASVSVSASETSLKGDARGESVVTDFDKFWECYPKKIGKKAAQRAWDKAKDRPPIEKVVESVHHQTCSEQWTKDGGQFIPHPATWINQGRWDDETLVSKKEQEKADMLAGKGTETEHGWEGMKNVRIL